MTKFTIDLNMKEEEAEFIEDKLIQHNLERAPVKDGPVFEKLGITLRGDDKKIYGGLIGKFYRSCLFIDILWVEESLRKHGYGAKMLKKAEEIAASKKCNFIHLDTFSFQAPSFYQSNGYEIFGTLEGYPDGVKRYFLNKKINS
ncbi:GNAT family N-acetyltransferase [uncultured Ilyobacter sp.]|uniref:GNAT family N-acetyltransferase n=1 Tax=uncultured Ilyobacter sp. TaxID=544433 RepID=UPI002AA8F901|nr:GNAT family N-acetyltransferase [uncultured Ilyobacter sp.]